MNKFEEWAISKGYSLEPGTLENGKGGRTYADDRTDAALHGYLAKQFELEDERQDEINALKKSLNFALDKLVSLKFDQHLAAIKERKS
jgi:hypothetical protein